MDLFICKISDYDLSGAELLPKPRKDAFDRYRLEDDKKRCLISGLMLRAVFGEKHIQITKDAYGKPYLPFGDFFSISHGGEYVILAVDEEKIGCDVEQIRIPPMLVAERCFTLNERRWPESKDGNGFFKLWTAKESIIKAEGKGFGIPMQSFEVLPMQDGAHEILGKSYYLQWLCFDGHVFCIASLKHERMTPIFLSKIRLLPIST